MDFITFRSSVLGCLFFLAAGFASLAQTSDGRDLTYRPIITAVPIITIAPDARSAGMGDAGVATTPDANASHWNAAKLGFLETELGASLSYTPWLTNIGVNDMHLAYLSGHKKMGENSTLAISLLYFDMGEIRFTDIQGNQTDYFNPKEYAFSAAYGQRLSENLSLGVAARFIRSNLAGNANISGGQGSVESQPGNSAAVDLGIYYTKDLSIGARNYNLALGGNISNIGGKITYSNAGRKDFLPTNLRIGTALTMELDPYNKITLAIDGNKLLVPYSPPNDASVYDDTNVFSGIIKSFNDAEGGFSEEAKEINISTGLEYWYDNLFAARAGYFYENELKGGRNYFTMGLGIKYQKFGFDGAYLIPTEQGNPLANTFRFTLHFRLDETE